MKRNRVASWLVAVQLATMPLAGCSVGSRPDVVVVLLDAVRADRLEPYGARSGASPVLARLAADAIVFENAYSSSSFTAPSTASLFTGQYATRHGITYGLRARDRTYKSVEKAKIRPFAADARLLPALMKESGYTTFGISTNPNVGEELGFDSGFDRFVRIRMAGPVIDQLEEWSKAISEASPAFVYLHVNDAHKPYWPRERWLRGKGKLAAYESEIAYVDDALEQMLAIVDPDRDAVVVVVTDHGEEFGDHGGRGHGFSLYDELNRIAFLLRAEGFESNRIETNVSIIDVLPTLLEILGIERPADLDGRSLVELIRAETRGDVPADWRERPIFAHRQEQSSRGRELAAVILGSWKLVVGEEGPELYDLAKDPEEERDLATRRPKRVESMSKLLATMPREDAAERELEEVDLDAAQLEELRALGYVDP